MDVNEFEYGYGWVWIEHGWIWRLVAAWPTACFHLLVIGTVQRQQSNLPPSEIPLTGALPWWWCPVSPCRFSSGIAKWCHEGGGDSPDLLSRWRLPSSWSLSLTRQTRQRLCKQSGDQWHPQSSPGHCAHRHWALAWRCSGRASSNYNLKVTPNWTRPIFHQ